MTSEQERIRNLERLPVFLMAKQTADLLGLEEHEIHILARIGLLPVLANARKNEKKQFSSIAIERMLNEDPDWPDKARRAIINFHRRKNASRRANQSRPQHQENEHPLKQNKSGKTHDLGPEIYSIHSA